MTHINMNPEGVLEVANKLDDLANRLELVSTENVPKASPVPAGAEAVSIVTSGTMVGNASNYQLAAREGILQLRAAAATLRENVEKVVNKDIDNTIQQGLLP